MKITDELLIKKLGLKVGKRYVLNNWEVILIMPNCFVKRADSRLYSLKLLVGQNIEKVSDF